MRSKFKDEHPFEKRKAEAERIRQKYADRIPVSCEEALTHLVFAVIIVSPFYELPLSRKTGFQTLPLILISR